MSSDEETDGAFDAEWIERNREEAAKGLAALDLEGAAKDLDELKSDIEEVKAVAKDMEERESILTEGKKHSSISKDTSKSAAERSKASAKLEESVSKLSEIDSKTASDMAKLTESASKKGLDRSKVLRAVKLYHDESENARIRRMLEFSQSLSICFVIDATGSMAMENVFEVVLKNQIKEIIKTLKEENKSVEFEDRVPMSRIMPAAAKSPHTWTTTPNVGEKVQIYSIKYGEWLTGEIKSETTAVGNEKAYNTTIFPVSTRAELGAVLYRDPEDGAKHFEIVPFTFKTTEFTAQTKGMKPSGGGDQCEDVIGALEKAADLDWKCENKLLFLCGDAPCHGRDYHDDGCSDSHPSGLGKASEPFLHRLMEKNVQIFFWKINSTTDKMIRKFNEECARFRGQNKVERPKDAYIQSIPVDVTSAEAIRNSLSKSLSATASASLTASRTSSERARPKDVKHSFKFLSTTLGSIPEKDDSDNEAPAHGGVTAGDRRKVGGGSGGTTDTAGHVFVTKGGRRA